jgi:hypothetical protein
MAPEDRAVDSETSIEIRPSLTQPDSANSELRAQSSELSKTERALSFDRALRFSCLPRPKCYGLATVSVTGAVMMASPFEFTPIATTSMVLALVVRET